MGRAMPTEIEEEYLETIYELTERGQAIAKTSEIAAKMNLSPASVTEMVQRLANSGYLDYKKYKGATLTVDGLRIARHIKRKHRLLERFLVDVLGVKKEKSHEEACRLEHGISEDSERMICQLTNNPQYCPDGDPIPECVDKQCPQCRGLPSVRLGELHEGESGEITHLKGEEASSIRRLISMGFVPGRTVTMEEHAPMGGPLLVRLQDSRVALAKDYADLVLVRAKECRPSGGGAIPSAAD